MGNRDIGEGERRLTNSPTPIEGINELMYDENRKYPNSPTSDVGSRAKSPILPRARDSGSERIRGSGDSIRRTRGC